MTDKDFEQLLKDALTCDEVPESLNESLVLSAKKQQNKKAKILSFVKATSSCAAVFVCAVAVLSYFNSDLFSQKNTQNLLVIQAITLPIPQEYFTEGQTSANDTLLFHLPQSLDVKQQSVSSCNHFKSRRMPSAIL